MGFCIILSNGKSGEKKKSKYDIVFKTDLTADQLLQIAINTSPKKSKIKKK